MEKEPDGKDNVSDGNKDENLGKSIENWQKVTSKGSEGKRLAAIAKKWKESTDKKKNTASKQEERDPTTLELFKEAARRNAVLRHREMSDTSQKRQDERPLAHSSRSRDKNLTRKSRPREETQGTRDRRSKNSTDTTKQSEQNELNCINGLSHLSSDRFPPQSNTQRVVYFQNRFIILDAADRNTGSTNSTINVDKNGKNNYDIKSVGKMDSMETSFSKMNSKPESKNKSNRKDIEMDASSVTMDARGIDIILTDPDNSSKQIKNMDSFNTDESKERNSIWRKINRVLLDDRVKASNGQIILENRHPEEYRILKKVLNILFLTIGITLFVSVIIVVIYALIVGDDKNDSFIQPTSTAAKVTTTPAPPT